MESMAELMKKLGWIAWCLTVIGWFLSPIMSLLVNKLFPYVVFDASKKLKELENEIIRELKKKVSAVEEQTMLRAAEDKGSQSDLKILESLKMDLKSALYRRIEKGLPHGDDDSVWVENQLAAACAWIARCKGSCFGGWMHVTMAAVIKGAQSLTQLWQKFDLACVRRAMNIAATAVLQCCFQPLGQLFTILQCAQSWYPQLGQLFRSVPLLPVSINPTGQPPSIQESRGSEFVLAGPARPAEQTSVSLLRRCAGSMLTWYAKACFHRDWSYGIVGIKSDKKDASAVESLVPITERISLFKQIKRIEGIINTSNKLDLLNHKNSGSSSKDTDKNSSNGTAQNADKESNSKQKEIDELYRSIENKVFGRDKDGAHISRMLREAPDTYAASTSTIKPYSVIGIYGITGSGKSTLAQYVCDFEKSTQAGRHFDPVMFILVGKTFRVGDIFRDMLEQITQSRPPNDEGLKSLKTKLEEKLKDKRFLLVLDDLWVNDDDRKELDILLHMLSTALRGSRVLVTSQKTDAAQALGAQEQISIPDLEEGVYLSLFMHHARPDASADDGEYERIGRKIANRLGRSPIAAVTVGKQLQRNKSISFWETTANLDVLNKTMGALWWSYQQLGDDIKRCFAYCSTFPKGYVLRRDELVVMWIAQGFVNTRSNAKEEVEDVGQRYFDELLTFSFLQKDWSFPGKKGAISNLFRIHDLLHELAKRISGSEFDRIGLNGSTDDIPRGVDHLFIKTNNVAEINEKILDLQNLRTLIINEDYYVVPPEETIKRNHDIEKLLGRLFMRLTKLRVLIIGLNYIGTKLSVPASIDQMKHLRYLGFHCAVILPNTISKLYLIQTIDLPGLVTSWPRDMANLIYLRNVPTLLNFANIGRLRSLQRLPAFKVREEQGYELKQLMHLNKIRGSLNIYDLQFVGTKEKALEAHLTHKERLRELSLFFGHDIEKRFGPDEEAEVLEGLCPPKDLQELQIENYRGSRYPSWMLSRHHSEVSPKHLHTLDLRHCSQLASIPEDSELFIGLRKLIILDCNWDRLPQNMERLVSLQILDICHCHKIDLLPTLPHHTLKKITIINCTMLSRTCIEEGHDNWHKIQNISEYHVSWDILDLGGWSQCKIGDAIITSAACSHSYY